jgi:hypothetical protein
MKSHDPKKPATPPTYEVGYKRPPKKGRFAKGRSGNPAGRPRGSKRNQSVHIFEEPVNGLMVEEFYRPVTIREGDKVTRVSAVQAALRGLALSAAKGSLRAQREVLALLRSVEADRRRENDKRLRTAIEYKVRWEHKRWGVDEADVVPHPDDILINHSTGEVTYKGPISRAQRDAQDQMVAMRPQIVEDIRKIQRCLVDEPDNPTLKAALSEYREFLNEIAEVEVLVARRAAKSPKK